MIIAASVSLALQSAQGAVGYSITHWYNRIGHGLRIQTNHYTIYTTIADPDLLDKAARLMEAAHQAYNQLLPYPVEPRTRSVIYLFSNRQQWEAFILDFAGTQAQTLLKITNGAVCHNGTCIAYDIGKDQTLSALAHEGWHQFTSRHFALRLPSWLDEGMAMTFEAFRQTQDGFVFCPSANSYRLQAVGRFLSNGFGMDLSELLASSPGEVLATDQSEQVQALYARWFCLVMFLQDRYQHGLQRSLHDAFLGRWQLTGPLAIVAADRNIPRTTAWNRIVGPWLFGYYIADDTKTVQQELSRYCLQLASGKPHLGPGLAICKEATTP